MPQKVEIFCGPVLAALAVAVPMALTACSKADGSAAVRTPGGEERQVAGRATETKLTACGPAQGKPGTCEGTLVVQPTEPGAMAVTLEVTRDVLLKKGDQAVFLPQLRDSQVVVKYRASKEGPNVATSVVGQ